ncbi:MAG TPA: DUF1059 domain-containing protein [Opitutaceae bacterium]
MKTGSLAALVAFGVALSVAAVVGADETKTPQKTDASPTEKVTVYSVRCDDPCPFSVQSTDKQEVIAIVTEHAKSHHHMNVSSQDCEAMIKTHEVMVRTSDPMKHEPMVTKPEPTEPPPM